MKKQHSTTTPADPVAPICAGMKLQGPTTAKHIDTSSGINEPGESPTDKYLEAATAGDQPHGGVYNSNAEGSGGDADGNSGFDISNNCLADLRRYSEKNWGQLGAIAIRMLATAAKGHVDQADLEDLVQDTLLRLWQYVLKPVTDSKRDDAPLRPYIRSALKNRLFEFYEERSLSQGNPPRAHKAVGASGDKDDQGDGGWHEVQPEEPQEILMDLEWVSISMEELKTEDRDHLKAIYYAEKTPLELAGGSKKIANMLCKRTSDAKRRYRILLLDYAAKQKVNIRGITKGIRHTEGGVI